MTYRNFSAMSKNLESACIAHAYRETRVKDARRLSAALDDIERFPIGSEEWKQAVRRNAETLSDAPGVF